MRSRSIAILIATIGVVAMAIAAGATRSESGGLGTTARADASTLEWTSSPFVSRPSRKTWYRIPAIIENSQGHLLAFAERRDSGRSDFGDFEVVMRRSTDGGRTWGTMKVVADDGRNRVSNPVPVLDPSTGHVLLLTSVRNANDTYKGIYLQRSKDGGSTFSSLSSGRVAVSGPWKGGLTGPGHGVVLTQGTHAGRIIVPLGYRQTPSYGAYCIYSDDRGATWRIGYDQADRTGSRGYMEGTVAELADGRLFVSYRDKRRSVFGKARYCGLSEDSGASFSNAFAHRTTLRVPSVQGSAITLTGPSAGTLLFSGPTSAYQGRPQRRDMGIFVSTNGGWSWGRPYQVDLDSRDAAYSDLVQVDDSAIGILYETGASSWRERIRFRRVAISELTTPTLVPSSVRASLSDKRISRRSRGRVKVVVRVRGTSSPPGRIVVSCSRAGRTPRTVSAGLRFTSKGVKYITLPRLARGKYRVLVTYKGTGRIKPMTVSVGTLRVR